MKKLFFILLVTFFATTAVQAQCTIDTSITHNVAGIYPDTITNLPHATVGVAYQTTIQMKITTTYLYLGTIPVPIDSLVFTSVTGLPAGYSYSCTPSTCSFPGGSDACILLYGPALSSPGTYPLVVNYTGYGRLFGSPQTLPSTVTGYTIVVDVNAGVSLMNVNRFDVGQNIPNPFGTITEVAVSSPANDVFTLKVSNLLGKTVYSRSVPVQRGINKIQIDAAELSAGIYLYTISDGKTSITRRMIVSNER